jgi:hypothetical protein
MALVTGCPLLDGQSEHVESSKQLRSGHFIAVNTGARSGRYRCTVRTRVVSGVTNDTPPQRGALGGGDLQEVPDKQHGKASKTNTAVAHKSQIGVKLG